MKITGIIVCVDFSDYLVETLPFSKSVLDDLYIITANDDQRTKELCKKTNTKFLSIPRTTPTFLKGIYINHAFDNVPHEDWFLITDADIVLPSEKIFDTSIAEKKPQCLYGVFCQYCYNYEEWIDYKDNGTIYNWKIQKRSMSIGMGAFQLFHTDHFKNRDNCRYLPWTIYVDKDNRGAIGSDKKFARSFKCRKQKLPFNIIHLDNSLNNKIHNYDGRKTEPFGRVKI